MDLELGLKITHTVDDHASSTNVRIAKDKSGPFFTSKETESTFILIAHLKGYRRERIQIDINEDGTQICISGEKPVQEKVMSGWIMYKKEVEMRDFRKVFGIPDGVVLDRIRARFNEHESTLTIVMPKLVKGIRGVGIEEVKEEAVDIGGKQMPQPTADEVPQKDSLRGENEKEFREPETKKRGIDEEESKNEVVVDEVPGKDIRGGKMQEEAKDSNIQSMQETPEFAAPKSEEPKIATMEEADGIDKEKAGRKELDSQHMVAEKTTKEDQSAEATPEVAKPLHETHPTEHHTKTKAFELSKLEEKMIQKSPEVEKEMPKSQLKEHVYRRPETGESSERVGDTVTTQQEAQVEHKDTADEISKDVDQLQNEEPTKAPSSSRKNEIEAAEDGEKYIKAKEVDKCESSESDKHCDMVEKLSDDLEKKPDLEKSNLLCSPFIIAGSALIVSLVMLAINRIKTRKR